MYLFMEKIEKGVQLFVREIQLFNYLTEIFRFGIKENLSA